MRKTTTVNEALRRLQDQPPGEVPSPEELQQIPVDLKRALTSLSNRMLSTARVNEALIDILKSFDLINIEIFDIALQNVREYERSPIETSKLLVIREKALRKKLADYSRSKDAPAEGSKATPAKPKPRPRKRPPA
jgi:hypothetical protein